MNMLYSSPVRQDEDGATGAPDFVITPEGRVTEVAIRATALRAAQLSPGVDPATVEAATMLVRVFKSIRDSGEAYLAPYGLSPSRIPVLETIYRSEQKRLTIRDIASALRVTPTNVSRMLDALEREGWVLKTPNPEDGRSLYVELTPWGRERLVELTPRMAARRMDMWSVLTRNEKQILSHLLAKLHMNVLSKSLTWDELGLPAGQS
jgi:DNA-binding MarR family transcriptional regulator